MSGTGPRGAPGRGRSGGDRTAPGRAGTQRVTAQSFSVIRFGSGGSYGEFAAR